MTRDRELLNQQNLAGEHHLRNLKISVGQHRRSNLVENIVRDWKDLATDLTTFRVTKETFDEYLDKPKDERQEIKDIGYLVGGWFDDECRRSQNLNGRSIITLDADHVLDAGASVSDILGAYRGKAFVAHSTHSHTDTDPRIRIVFPLSREVSPSEYPAVARCIAALSLLEVFDDTTYEPARPMFWPSRSRNGDELAKVGEGEVFDPDKLLCEFEIDLEDTTTWPRSSREGSVTSREPKAEDPLRKRGVIGAFCRAYSISDAIREWGLPYEPTSVDDRYSYIPGSTWGGAIVYDFDTLLYSNHGSDPLAGRAINAWDLVMHYEFGELDDGLPIEQFKPGQLPSFRAMVAMASEDPRVIEELDSQIDPSEEFGDIPPDYEIPDDSKPANDIAAILYPPPGLVGLVADYCLKSGHRYQPLLAICAGLSAVSSLTRNRFVVGRHRTPLNLYLLAVAESGEGKEAPRKAVRAMLKKLKRLDMIHDSVASTPGLLNALSQARNKSILFMPDEFGRFLKVAASPNSGHQYDLVSELLKLYGLADSDHSGRVYANTKNNIPTIERPFLSIFATTTQQSLVDAVGSREVVDGTLNRFLTVITLTRTPAFQEPNFDVVDELLEALNCVEDLDQDILEITRPNQVTAIPVTDQDERLLTDFRDTADLSRINNRELGPLWARAHENAMKVAGILAVGNCAASGSVNREDVAVTVDCAAWAIEFVQWCIEGVSILAKSEIGDNEADRTVRKIRQFIADVSADPGQFDSKLDRQHREQNKKGLISRSQVSKRFQYLPSRLTQDAILVLIASGDIASIKSEDGRSTYYRLNN